MKTVRFSQVVKQCGEPEDYLILMDPAKDRTFQAAVKTQRVMTSVSPVINGPRALSDYALRPALTFWQRCQRLSELPTGGVSGCVGSTEMTRDFDAG